MHHVLFADRAGRGGQDPCADGCSGCDAEYRTRRNDFCRTACTVQIPCSGRAKHQFGHCIRQLCDRRRTHRCSALKVTAIGRFQCREQNRRCQHKHRLLRSRRSGKPADRTGTQQKNQRTCAASHPKQTQRRTKHRWPFGRFGGGSHRREGKRKPGNNNRRCHAKNLKRKAIVAHAFRPNEVCKRHFENKAQKTADDIGGRQNQSPACVAMRTAFFAHSFNLTSRDFEAFTLRLILCGQEAGRTGEQSVRKHHRPHALFKGIIDLFTVDG